MKCAASDVSFKTRLDFVQAPLSVGHLGHGEVCSGQWVQHYVSIDNTFILSSNSTAAQQHRRRASQSSSNVGFDEYSSWHANVHLRLRVVKNEGLMSVVTKFNSAPTRLIPPYTVMDFGEPILQEDICAVGRFYDESRGAAASYYFGIYGGQTCATYEISVEAFTGPCTPNTTLTSMSDDNSKWASTIGATSSKWQCLRTDPSCTLPLGHSMRASCEANERVSPLTIALPYTPGTSWNNLVIEVTDLNLQDNPSSLSVSLYASRGGADQIAVRSRMGCLVWMALCVAVGERRCR